MTIIWKYQSTPSPGAYLGLFAWYQLEIMHGTKLKLSFHGWLLINFYKFQVNLWIISCQGVWNAALY